MPLSHSRLFRYCCDHPGATLQVVKAATRQAKNMATQSDNALRTSTTSHLRSRFLAVMSLATDALGHRISRQPVTRQPRDRGIRACRPTRDHLFNIHSLIEILKRKRKRKKKKLF